MPDRWGLYASFPLLGGELPSPEALVAGLAFVVLLFTFLTQQRSSEDTFQKLGEQTQAAQNLAKIQVLGLLRSNIGSQIYHLKGLVRETDRDGNDLPQKKLDEKEEELSLKDLTRDKAKARIIELKQELMEVENEARGVFKELGLKSKLSLDVNQETHSA